jgi:acyl dehydratase
MNLKWEDLSVGTQLPERAYGPLTITDFVRYQGASGDFNPIHHDDAFAKSAGFPEPFSVGMLQAGILGSYVTDLFGAENVRRFSVQFREQVWAGDRLICTGEVVAISDGADAGTGERSIDLKLNVARVGGGSAIKGEATFVVA